jgi:hypothetical protein
MSNAYDLVLHLRAGATHMAMQYSFDKRWEYFYEMRYTILSVYFPHKPFSVEQCTPDFFQDTLDYLHGIKELPKREAGNEYQNNYIDWVVSWKSQLEA